MPLTPEKVDAILQRVAAYGNTRKALRECEVHPMEWYRALNDDPVLCEQYARAKEQGMDALADETLEIADLTRLGMTTVTRADGSEEFTKKDMVERARLQVDTRKWLLSKLAPKKYGEKLTLAGDAENPIAIDDAAEVRRKLLSGAAAARAPEAPGEPE